MLRLFYLVDEDYGKRVQNNLGTSNEPGILEKIGKAIGLTGEKDDKSQKTMLSTEHTSRT
jgi:hypothetical protein